MEPFLPKLLYRWEAPSTRHFLQQLSYQLGPISPFRGGLRAEIAPAQQKTARQSHRMADRRRPLSCRASKFVAWLFAEVTCVVDPNLTGC